MELPLSARSFFEHVVPSLLSAHDGVIPDVIATFQVVGTEEGFWTIRAQGGHGTVDPVDANDAQLRFILSGAALVDILSGKLDAQIAINERAVTIQGDWSLLERLAFLFEPSHQDAVTPATSAARHTTPVQQVRFPHHAPRRRTLSALDIDLYAFLSAATNAAHPPELLLPAPLVTNIRSPRLRARLAEALATVVDEELYPDVVATTFLAAHLDSEADLPPFSSAKLRQAAAASVVADDTSFHWPGPAAWRAGFHPVLILLGRAYLSAYLHVIREKIPGVHWILSGVRTWPRQILSRFLSLGGHDADEEVPPACLLDELVETVAVEQSLAAMRRFGDPGWALEMTQSGFLAFENEALPPQFRDQDGQLSSDVLQSLPTGVNAFHFGNPSRLKVFRPAPQRGFLVDAHYQTLFTDTVLETAEALYGERPCMFHREFVDWFNRLAILETVRVKQYAVPVVEVGSVAELRSMLASFPRDSSSTLTYRGQTEQFELARGEFQRRLLYGDHQVREPSLPGAAPRKGLSYDQAHPTVQLLIQDLMYRSALDAGRDLKTVHQQWFALATSVGSEWDIGVMALAQHYGIPTSGIDVTSDLDVAVWFAVNRFVSDAGGRARYVEMQAADYPADRRRWPAIFVIQPAIESLKSSIWGVETLKSVGLSALRPTRQKALFFMGADGIHRNRLAEALVCVVRLRPGSYRTDLTYEYLFPPALRDPVYASMLDARARLSDGPLGAFFREIPAYAYP